MSGVSTKSLTEFVYGALRFALGLFVVVLSLFLAALAAQILHPTWQFWAHFSLSGKILFIWVFGIVLPISGLLFFVLLPSSLLPLIREVENRGCSLDVEREFLKHTRLAFNFTKIAEVLRKSELANDGITWGPRIEQTLRKWEWVFSIYHIPLLAIHFRAEAVLFGSVIVMVAMKFKSFLVLSLGH